MALPPRQGLSYTTLFNALQATMTATGDEPQPKIYPGYVGTCTPHRVQRHPIIMLPCGDITKPGDAGEGAIEIKAAWRKLDPTEMSKLGRFFTRNVIYYTGSPTAPADYNNDVWGLVALHIIHKTKSFPAFVFATWEQVDNYDDDTPDPNPRTWRSRISATTDPSQYPRDACPSDPLADPGDQRRGSCGFQGPSEPQYRLAVL